MAAVLSTESPVDDTAKTEIPFDDLVAFCNEARMADLLKRACFYSKKPDGPRRAAYIEEMIGLGRRCMSLGNQRMTFGQTKIDPKLLHAIVGLATEAGELIEELLSAICEDRPLNLDNIFEEFGDSSWYWIYGIAAARRSDLRFTPLDVLRANVAKLKARYPKTNLEGHGDRDLVAEKAAMDAAAPPTAKE